LLKRENSALDRVGSGRACPLCPGISDINFFRYCQGVVIAAVEDMQLSSAMTAPEKARKQKLATPDRALDGADAHPVGVVGDHALIPLKLVPAYVAFVTFPEKNVPFLWRASQSASDALAARLHADPAFLRKHFVRSVSSANWRAPELRLYPAVQQDTDQDCSHRTSGLGQAQQSGPSCFEQRCRCHRIGWDCGYAVIASNLSDDQVELVHEALDRLRQAGVTVLDQRDVDLKRYQKALGVWHEAVLDHVRLAVRELMAKRKRAAKSENRTFGLVDDELKINSASTEKELRDALKFLDRDDPIAMEQMFEEARRSVSMPEAPKSLQTLTEAEPMDVADLERAGVKRVDPARFRDFT
jgi:hypothetical protein